MGTWYTDGVVLALTMVVFAGSGSRGSVSKFFSDYFETVLRAGEKRF